MVKMPKWPVPIGYKDIDLGLDRMWKALEALGNPHLKLPKTVHFAGTNGKGSTLSFLKSILNEAGYTCHGYTSPHLIEFNERIVLADKVITDDYLNDVLNRTKEVCEDIDNITFFEGTTLAAFLAFSEVKADFLLLETGLGGNLDATNVVKTPEISVITSIDFDHMEFLGNEIEMIALEKAKILKPNSKAVISEQGHFGALKVVEGYAKEIGCKLFYSENTALPKEVVLGLQGKHQTINARTAVKCAEILNIEQQLIKTGLEKAKWPARLQKVEDTKLNQVLTGFNIILDGGHNPQAARAISNYVKTVKADKNIAIIGMTKTKDAENFAENLDGCFDEIICIDIPEYNDSAKAEEIATFFENSKVAKSFNEAVEYVKEDHKNGSLYICGSLYLAGWVLENYPNKLPS